MDSPLERKRWDQRKIRSEEHTSELQSPCNLVCRLLLEKKKKKQNARHGQLIAHRHPTPPRHGCPSTHPPSPQRWACPYTPPFLVCFSFFFFFFLMIGRPPNSPLFPYPTLSR